LELFYHRVPVKENAILIYSGRGFGPWPDHFPIGMAIGLIGAALAPRSFSDAAMKANS